MRAHFCGGVTPVDRLPREKHVALGPMGVRAVPFFHYYDHVLNLMVGEIYLEVCAVKIPLLTPLHRKVNFSRCPQELDLVRL